MGINIAIVTESGSWVDSVLDPTAMTQAFIPDYSKANSPCLRFIDPYGDTVFNRLQIPLLINELQEALSHISDKQIAAHGWAIVKLACRAQQNIHQYIKFIGD